MKTRKNKLVNFLKTGILLFVVSLSLWNCEKQDDSLEFQQNSEYISNSRNYFDTLSLAKHQEELLSLSKNIDWNNSKIFKENNNTIVEVFLTSKNNSFIKTDDDSIIKFHNRIVFIFDTEKKIEYYFTTVISSSNQLDFISNKENINYSKVSDKFSGSIFIENKEGQSFVNKYINGELQNKTSNNLYAKVEGGCYIVVELFSDGNTRSVPGSRFCLWITNESTYRSGYHGGGSSNGNNNSADDDKIDASQLTDKAKCVYDKMVDNKNNINWILENFKDGNTPSEFDLKFVMATDLPNSVNGRTLPVKNNMVVIKINSNTLSNRTSLEVARTILHEGIHARLEEFAKRKGSNATDFPGIYDYYRRNNKNTWSHQQMAAHYINTIAKGLKQFDNGQHSNQYYNDLAWNGLYKISNGANNPPILTDAWNTLSPSEKTRIKNTIKSEHINGNKNCN